MFGSDRFAGTITERPTGSTSGGGSSWRPWRGCSARVKLPGGSLPIRVRVSRPSRRSASAWSSACSTTPPQNDQLYGTTMPTFTARTMPHEPEARRRECPRPGCAAPPHRNPSPRGPPHLLPGSSVSRKPLRVCNGTAPKVRQVPEVDSADGRRPRRAPHAPRRLGRLRHPLEPGPRAGHRPPGQGLLGVRPPRHGLRRARRPEPRRARPHLPLDGADPVQPARRRALRPRRDRRRVPLAAHHDARAALQPDEAQPRRRARPRPHHPRRDPRPRPREPRVPAGARRADPDDGPDVQPRPERDRRREGHPLGAPRRRRHRHRRPPPGRRAATTTARSSPTSRRRARTASASRSTSARKAATSAGARSPT